MVRFNVAILCIALFLSTTGARAAGEPLSLAADIALRSAHDGCAEARDSVAYSLDGKYFLVYSTRGSLETNEVTDEIRIYRTSDVEDYLRAKSTRSPPAAYWVVAGSNDAGPVITACRWLANSRGVAFLQRLSTGNRVLKLADISRRDIKSLSPSEVSVQEFDIRDAEHFAYRVAMLSKLEAPAPTALSMSVSGRSLASLLVPDGLASLRRTSGVVGATGHLWAAVGGPPFEVVHGDTPIVVSAHAAPIALVPSGDSVVTVAPVDNVPSDWEQQYPPPTAGALYRIRAGARDPDDLFGARRYVRIDLRSGSEFRLAEGPTGFAAGYPAQDAASWSKDGHRIIISSAYAGASVGGRRRPCVAVLDVASELTTCLFRLWEPTERPGFGIEGIFGPTSVDFEQGDAHIARVTILDQTENRKALYFTESSPGLWQASRLREDTRTGPRGLRIWIDEDSNRSPRLMAARGKEVAILWDLNPQIAAFSLAKVSVYHWHDPSGREWTGGLYTPQGFEKGKRYPLVIQTHGFIEHQFNPDGMYTTGSAAQSLAAAGMLVLQVRDGALCDSTQEKNEARCATAGYDAAVRQLTVDGYIDPDRVGIEGFSRTCLYVTHALVFGQTRYVAATLTDGVMESYMLYFTMLDNGAWPRESDEMMGPPFGAGLSKWINESSIFNLERTTAAVQVNALGKVSLMQMWEPYARLRKFNKPVDLVMLDTSEHVVTNPQIRLASQGSAVDWFRFWLKAQEDPAPEKHEQYARWRALRDERSPTALR